MPEEIEVSILDVTSLEIGQRVLINMQRKGDGVDYKAYKPRTVFDIAGLGEEPWINIRLTPEGPVSGETVVFVGSIATKAELYEKEPDIKTGLIIPEHRLLVRQIGKSQSISFLPGIVVQAQAISKRR